MYRLLCLYLSFLLLSVNGLVEEFDGENCELTHAGFYGLKALHNVSLDVVDYYYKIVYKQNANFTDIKHDVDMAIGQTVLESSAFFVDCLDDSGTLDNDIHVFAMSTRPHDAESDIKICDDEISSTEICAVMEGELSIFYDEGRTNMGKLEDTFKRIKQLIHNSMGESGGLANVNQGVVKVEYITRKHFMGLPDAKDISDIDDFMQDIDDTMQAADNPKSGDAQSGLISNGGGEHSWKFIVAFGSVLGVLSMLMLTLAYLKWKTVKAQEPKARFDSSTVGDSTVV